MTEKYLMFSLEDEKTRKIAEILGSSSCRKILDFLAEREGASESDVSKELGMPLNTIEYNIKKLVESGLIEKGNHWWSVKGKKIEMYKVARKHIVISHKAKPSYSKLKSILPAVLAAGILTFFVKIFTSTGKIKSQMDYVAAPASLKAAESASSGAAANAAASVFAMPIWAWFSIGALIAMLLLVLLNWRKL